MYGNNYGWGHDSIGSIYSKSAWFFAEGCTKGTSRPGYWPSTCPTVTEIAMVFLTDQGVIEGPREVLGRLRGSHISPGII